MKDPHIVKRSDGRCTEVYDHNTERAKELMLIYNSLKMKNVTLDERLDILFNTKMTVVHSEADVSEEIEELINREADMINRGRPEKSLEGMINLTVGLRLRLCNLFLQFIEDPQSNPEAARYQKIPIKLLNNDLQRQRELDAS